MKIKKDEIIWLILFITPAISLFFLFFILPILFLFVTSFTNWDGISAEFVGLENYVKLLNKKTFISLRKGYTEDITQLMASLLGYLILFCISRA